MAKKQKLEFEKPPTESVHYVPDSVDLTSIQGTPDEREEKLTESKQKEKPKRQLKEVLDLTTPRLLPGIGEIALLPLDRILDSPYQSREERGTLAVLASDEEDFQQLVHSIKTVKKRLLLFVCPHPEQPGFYFPVMGGHRRRDAAISAGLLEIPVIIIDYDQKEAGLGTAQENLSRRDLSIVAKGRLFKKLRTDFGWSQQRLADELGIPEIKRDSIAACEQTTKYAEDIQRMLLEKGGGIRAAIYLEQLTEFYKDQPGKAEEIRAPLIEAFQAEEISTDAVRRQVESILSAKEKRSNLSFLEHEELPLMRRWTRIERVEKDLLGYKKLKGDEPLSEPEREKLTTIRDGINELIGQG